MNARLKATRFSLRQMPTEQEFLNCDDEQFEREKYLNSKSEFILCGDEFAEEIDSPLDLEEALNSWGVY